jgi:hypothetical protein
MRRNDPGSALEGRHEVAGQGIEGELGADQVVLGLVARAALVRLAEIVLRSTVEPANRGYLGDVG